MNSKNEKYDLLTISNSPELKVIHCSAKGSPKGSIIFVHGICHGAWCFENFMDFFSENEYECFALNLRGHSENNRKDLKDATLSDYANDVKKFVDYCTAHCNKKGITEKPFLLGHSMGGAIVQKYIGKYSNTVKGAILFAPATAGGMGIYEKIRPILKNGLKDALKIFGLNNNNKPVPVEVMARSAFFSDRISLEQIGLYNEKLHNESKKATKDLGKAYTNNYNIDIPILVIGSKDDDYFGEESLNKTAAAYQCFKSNTKKQLIILSDLCHDMMLDPEWEKSAKAVLEFIDNNK